jgi:hypothetical protein
MAWVASGRKMFAEKRESLVKKLIVISALAVFLAVSIVAIVGCGSASPSSGSTTDDIQKVADAFIQAQLNGDAQAILSMLPPADRDTYAPLLQQDVPPIQGKVDEVHYQIDQPDADHANVSFWGSFEITENGQTIPQTIAEENPQELPPMVRQDGQWYFDLSGMVSTSGQSGGTQPQQ